MDWQGFNLLGKIYFSEPDKLELLKVVPVLFLIWLVVWLLRLKLRPKRTYGSRYSVLGSLVLWLGLIVSLAPIIGAWADPFLLEGNVVIRRGNVEVAFIVDYSASMFLKDTGLARIDIATREIMKLSAAGILREGDRAGLFVLGSMGSRRYPMTEDIPDFISEVSTIGLPKTLTGDNLYWGSDVGGTFERVYLSLDRQDIFAQFRLKEPTGWKPKFRTNRLAIILSDGDFFNYPEKDQDRENKEKEKLEDALKEFMRRGIKVYPIGIGTTTGGRLSDILVDYNKGTDYDDKVEEDFQGQTSRLNVSYLEHIKSRTGAMGPFLIQNNVGDASSFIELAFDHHRSTKIETAMNHEKEELWLYFLLVAIAIGVLGYVLSRF